MDKPPTAPRLSPRAAAEKKTREERLAAALRENLRKRKGQARARSDGTLPAQTDKTEPA
jgi:hypothetical protein